MIPYHIIMIALMALSTFYFIFMLGNKYSSWNYIAQTSFPIGLQTYKDLLDGIEVNCKGILRDDENATLQAKNWTFDTYPIEERLFFAQDRIWYNNKWTTTMQALAKVEKVGESYAQGGHTSAKMRAITKCRAIDDLFGFNTKTTSQEELDFPLAYGAVVYTNLVQQLSGVDVPLKTNLEMVKILKALNNTVNAEISKFQKDRLTEKKIEDSPLPLFKSSLSAIVPRKAIDRIIKTKKGHELLHFLNGTEIPDESFWTTITGNAQNFTVPGGANAAQWMKFRDEYRKNHEEVVVEYEKSAVKEALMNYYLARHQIWDSPCGGEFVQGSCVYGVSDVSNVLKQPHLIAHKMYLHFQPAAFFCVLKELRNRERKPIALNLTQYAKLPQVELSAGVPHENITHPLWMFGG
ncbi:hypothetical protein RB195_004508 [Necator americanus]|uniref:Uncharacterized protein n=1 Tax=Necator americanus TaxID=51031 RepID=A0ABR1BMA2_NECAM